MEAPVIKAYKNIHLSIGIVCTLSIPYFVRPRFTRQKKDQKKNWCKNMSFKAKKGKNKYNMFEW